jgi:hypothetical protein
MPDGTPVSPGTLRGVLRGALAGALLTLPIGALGALPGGVVGWLRGGVGSLRDMRIRAACSHCGYGWDVFASTQSLINTPPGAMTVYQIVETVRSEELIGDELRKIDNSSTSTSAVRRLRAARRWTKTCDVHLERASTTIRGWDWIVPNLTGYRSSVETAIKQNYAITAEAEQSFEEEIELTVPARTNVQLRLRWKRLWQEGYVVMTGPDNQMVNIPFRTVIGVTFDQESVDS